MAFYESRLVTKTGTKRLERQLITLAGYYNVVSKEIDQYYTQNL
jgi:hypothetical protein